MPLMIAPESAVAGFVQVPKVFLLFFAEATALRALGREEEAEHIIQYFERKVLPTIPEVEAIIQTLRAENG